VTFDEEETRHANPNRFIPAAVLGILLWAAIAWLLAWVIN
jgi:membrane protein DedA with SNARE-associated domain